MEAKKDIDIKGSNIVAKEEARAVFAYIPASFLCFLVGRAFCNTSLTSGFIRARRGTI